MYYSHPCPYCSKVFFTELSNRTHAAQTLYEGIKEHQRRYGEDAKEHTMDQAPSIEINQIYREMTQLDEKPYGGNEV